MLSLLLLDGQDEMVRAILLALEIRVELRRVRVVDELQFLG